LEKIEIVATYAISPITGYKHLFVLYTNDLGQQFYIRGGPNNLFLDYIDVQYGAYTPSSPDWIEPGEMFNFPSVVVAEGTDLSGLYDEMVVVSEEIDAARIPYRGYETNSNSVVFEVVDRVGLEPRLPPGVHNSDDGDAGNDDAPAADATALDDDLAASQKEKSETVDNPSQPGLCFAAGTPVRMADGTEKPIEQVKIGEWVMAFDPNAKSGRGKLVPSQVTRTMVNHGQLLLDFHGTKVTPGHVFLTGEEDASGKGVFKRLIDILVEDGTVVNADGTVLRAATNFPVGSPEDKFIELAEIWPENGSIGSRLARVRAGTRLIRKDGTATTLLDSMTREGFDLLPDGRVSHRGGPPERFLMQALVPRPETYVLKRSGLTLEQIYAHGSLRDVAPAAMAARAMRRSSGESMPVAGDMQFAPAAPRGGWPQGWTPSVHNADSLPKRGNAPTGNRASRRRAEAEARKQAKRKLH